MCKIVKMSYNAGSLVVEASASRELNNCIFEMYAYNFYKGEYELRFKQPITQQHMAQDNGLYRFRYEVASNQRIKCAITDNGQVCASRERFVGELNSKINIRVSSMPSDIGTLFAVKSDISISRKLIYYNPPSSDTRIYLPADLIGGETLLFKIKSGGFTPKLTCDSEFSDCFSIVG